MRLELTAPLDLLQAADGDSETPTPRLVGGLAVPWNQAARLTNGRLVRFLPGSLTFDADRPPLLLRDHDRTQPIGVLVDVEDRDEGPYARARVSRTAAGDEALTLAADGVLRGLSVGVDAHEFSEDGDPADPVVVVSAGRWEELSLVPWQAYQEATVDLVTASSPIDPEPEPDDPTPEPEEPAELEASKVRHPARTPAPRPTSSGLTTSTFLGVAREMCATARAAGPGGELMALTPFLDRLNAMSLRAALTDVTTPSGTSGVAGLVRPDYQNEVVGLIEHGAPVVNAFLQGNATSSPVSYPKWTTLPNVDVQATQKSLIGTGPVRIDAATANLVTYATGNDVALQVLDWSTPDFIAEYFKAAAEMYLREIDAAMLTTIQTAATEQEQTGTLAAAIGAAIGTVAATGLMPDRILVGGAAFGELWSANVGIQSGGIQQVLNVDFPNPTVVFCPLATASMCLVTSSQVAKSWQNRGAPVQLRALQVDLLGINLGIYGYFAHAIIQGPTTANPAIISVVNEA